MLGEPDYVFVVLDPVGKNIMCASVDGMKNVDKWTSMS